MTRFGSKGVQGVLGAAAAVLATASPFASFAASPDPAKTPLRFVLLTKVAHPWFDQVHEGALAAARMLSSQTGRPVTIDYRNPARATIPLQQEMLRQAIATKPDGIFIDLLDSAQLNPLLRQARDQGIGLALFDSKSPADLPITTVGNDDCRLARLASERLATLLEGKGDVAIMQGVPTAPNHAIRFRCHQEALQRFPGIRVVATPIDEDSIALAERQAVDTMKAHPGLRGWVASDASGPVGIGRAIQRLGLQGRVKAVGLDDVPELVGFVRSGVVESSMATRPRTQGYWAVLSLWQQSLQAPVIERIDTGITVVK
jgi:ribose transport system substrate-binding protein